MCKKSFPGIVHNKDSLKHGVLRRVLAQSIKCPGHPENSEQQQTVELLVAAELVSDTSKQVSLVEVQNMLAEKVSDPGYVISEDIFIDIAECQLDIAIFTMCNSA